MQDNFDQLAGMKAQPVTRRKALKQFGIGCAAIALAKFGVNQVQAITNGTLDGNAHPNVGAAVWLKNPWLSTTAPVVCGCGTLIHPRILLTAGHGTALIQTQIGQGAMSLADILVSFAPNALDSSSWRSLSSVVTHPNYAAAAQTENGAGSIPLADVGVLVLREPVTGVPLAQLPALGLLDALEAAGALRPGSIDSKFTIVGYGAVLGDPVGQTPFPPEGLRRVAQSSFVTLDSRWLFLNQNSSQGYGGGGTCDSGGPAFWIDPATNSTTLVATTSRGDARSAAIGIDYRLDTAEALDFINLMLTQVQAGLL